jgi:hypothetical protein
MTKFRAMQGSTLQAQYLVAYDPLAGDGADRKLLFDSRVYHASNTEYTLSLSVSLPASACIRPHDSKSQDYGRGSHAPVRWKRS